MITKAIILERIINSNTYAVRVPFLESSGIKTGKIIATLSDNPAISEEYRVGDVVYVGFEEHQAEKVVILGKLSLNENEPRGHANLESLDVQNSARLPKNTTIGDVDYSEILSAFRKFDSKQDTLIPGNNITIENNVISASGGGGGEPDNYLVSASVSGNNLTLTPNTGNPIVYSPASVNWGDIQGTLSNQTDLQEVLDSKVELYEVQPTDIESIEGTLVTFTKDLSDKITSGKYIFKFNSNLFESEPDLDNYSEMIIKPAFNMQSDWIGQGLKLYTYETVIHFFDTGITIYRFIYNEQLDRVLADTEQSISSTPIPITLMAGDNNIQLNTGDAGTGAAVYFASINGNSILGSYNIEIPNDYHEPRFNSGLGIASSSNVSEIYVPYATSNTYGVIQDLYSNYLPLSGGTLTGSLTATEFTISNNKGDVNFYLDNSGNLNLWLGHNSAEPLGQTGDLQIPYDIQGTVITEENVSLNYVPYSGATKAVDLGNKKLTTGMLHATSFVDFDKAINLGLYSSSAHILFYTGDGSNQHYATLGPNSTTSSTASIILPSQSGVLALQSELPTVYNAGLTIQLNSSTIGTFTANASNSSTINIDLSEYATESWVESNYLNIQGGRLYGGITAQKDNTQGATIKVLAGENNQGAGEAAITVTDSYYPEGRLLLKDAMGGTTTFTPSAIYPLGNQYSITIPDNISQNETFATQNWVSTNSFASFHTSSLYASTIIISNRTLNGVYTKSEALAILNGTSSVL